jgi:hypothetical protein
VTRYLVRRMAGGVLASLAIAAAWAVLSHVGLYRAGQHGVISPASTGLPNTNAAGKTDSSRRGRCYSGWTISPTTGRCAAPQAR